MQGQSDGKRHGLGFARQQAQTELNSAGSSESRRRLWFLLLEAAVWVQQREIASSADGCSDYSRAAAEASQVAVEPLDAENDGRRTQPRQTTPGSDCGQESGG
jgi:hypothetical protein